MLFPKQIKLNGTDSLTITWNNDKVHTFPLRFLRDESPDAGNKGETILWKHYDPIPKSPDKPGKYEVQNIKVVGEYAINIVWKDGYSYGIYSWDLLWRLGEYLEVKENLHQDFEHDHNHEHHNKKKKERDE
ncbi:MAG: gamma-butyrobetaine hydroxylase-like domain-containing protein [Ignavibacteriales bacterium]